VEKVAVVSFSVKVVAGLPSFFNKPLFHQKTAHPIIELGFISQDFDEIPFGRATCFRIDTIQ
jgi:hypothetical protein